MANRYLITNTFMPLIGSLGIMLLIGTIWISWLPTELLARHSILYVSEIWLMNIPLLIAWCFITYIGFARANSMLPWSLPICLGMGFDAFSYFLRLSKLNTVGYLPMQFLSAVEITTTIIILLTLFIYLREKRKQGKFVEDFLLDESQYRLTKIQKRFLQRYYLFKLNPKLITLIKFNFKFYFLYLIYFVFMIAFTIVIGSWQIAFILIGVLLGEMIYHIAQITIFLQVQTIMHSIINFQKVEEILSTKKPD